MLKLQKAQEEPSLSPPELPGALLWSRLQPSSLATGIWLGCHMWSQRKNHSICHCEANEWFSSGGRHKECFEVVRLFFIHRSIYVELGLCSWLELYMLGCLRSLLCICYCVMDSQRSTLLNSRLWLTFHQLNKWRQLWWACCLTSRLRHYHRASHLHFHWSSCLKSHPKATAGSSYEELEKSMGIFTIGRGN